MITLRAYRVPALLHRCRKLSDQTDEHKYVDQIWS
nr:MAG TPA: hypothetical protein [Caudoviricetes sp.]